MHPAAMDWVAKWRTDEPIVVCDLGGRNINGTVKDLFPKAEFVSVDYIDGRGVDIVADAATWDPDREYDLVTCCEVFEHFKDWPAIIRTAFRALRPGGRVVTTCAGPGRPAHSAIDGGFQLHPGEWYGNVTKDDLRTALEHAGFEDIWVDYRIDPCDTRSTAIRPAYLEFAA